MCVIYFYFYSGEYDCTNVIRNPIVCGISTLDFDHTSILGSTIAQIAWHKAGIMKKNSILLTVPQLPEAMVNHLENTILFVIRIKIFRKR